jgi:hypothetical protein
VKGFAERIRIRMWWRDLKMKNSFINNVIRNNLIIILVTKTTKKSNYSENDFYFLYF